LGVVSQVFFFVDSVECFRFKIVCLAQKDSATLGPVINLGDPRQLVAPMPKFYLFAAVVFGFLELVCVAETHD